MFTPQRNAPWTPPSSAPRTTPMGSLSRFSVTDKGKAVAFVDGPPPPRSSLESEIIRRGENVEDWKRFKEAGLLDESSLERKDRQALLDKVAKLEKELFDYQYNMGLLLIEKKDLISTNDELREEMAEAEEILKREQAAHLMAISEAERRQENLKKALETEKKCLADLEKALRDMQEEHANLKASSATTISDVNARIESLEKKRLDIEAKAHVADAKLAAADRKNSELDNKLHDLEVRENAVRRERISLSEEKEAHKTYLQKQKDDLIEWERKLQEGEQRLCDSRRFLKEREDALSEADRTSQEKKAYLNELQQKINLADATLKKMECDMQNKSADLDLHEKKAEAMRCELEIREKELLEKEAKLNTRESVELENLLNQHKTKLDAEIYKFESEMKQNRESFEEECKSRKQQVEQKESEISHLEVKLGKREQALEKKSERLKEKEKEAQVKLDALKEKEKSLKAEEKRFEADKKKMDADAEGLEDLRRELEMMKSNLRNEELQIEEGQKNLEVLQAERSECARLQSNLQQALENARRQSELIEKEAEDLRLDREKFEKEWEALDEKRAGVDNELKTLAEERATFEKLRSNEENRLQRERAETEEHLRLESEKIRLQIESFEATMEHEKKMLDEKAKDDARLVRHDLDRKREEFYCDMEKTQRKMEELRKGKERALEEKRLIDVQTISNLKRDAEKTKEDMEIERWHLEKERKEMETIKKQLQETSSEMSKDIEALDSLRKAMKKQREEFSSERRLFCAFLEKIKGCMNCGDSAQAFLRHDLQLSTLEGLSYHNGGDADDVGAPSRELGSQMSPSSIAVKGISSKLGGQMSVLRKCASIIFKSPNSKTNDPVENESPSTTAEITANGNGSSQVVLGTDEVDLRANSYGIDANGRSFRIEDYSHAIPSVDGSNIESAKLGLEVPKESDSKTSQRKPARKRVPGVRRTHSVKAVVEDAKAILGEGSFGKTLEQPNDSGDISTQQESSKTDSKISKGARKRSHSQASRVTESEQDLDHSDGIADSVTTGARRKRRQTSATVSSTPGQRRYFLRRHTATETATTQQASDGKPKNEGEVPSSPDRAVENPDDTPSQSVDVAVESGRRSNLVQVSTTRSIEFTSERVVRFDTSANLVEGHVAAKSTGHNLSAGNTIGPEEVNENEEDPEEGSSSGDPNEGQVKNEDEEEEEEEEDEDHYDNHPGETSVGKKLWKFFTS